jgi:hypothetical protein
MAGTGGGLVVDEDKSQGGEGTGVLAGPLQLSERDPHRAGQVSSVGVRSKPGQRPGG